jgi:uncharacterized membrane protein YozB (DUF420 family)
MMQSLTPSDKYAMAASIALLIMVLFDNAVLMLVVSVIGLLVGIWVMRQGETRRVAWVAAAAFMIALVFALVGLLR